MSRKRKDHNGFKTPSLITNNQYGGTLPYNGSQSVPMSQDLDVIGDMDEIEVESTYIRYTGSGQLNNNHTNNINKSSMISNRQMHELNDQEPYNRRESYIQDINHEPYWQQEKESGLHPFQTPKSTKNDNTPFFNKNILNHNDNESPIPTINKLVDTPGNNSINSMNQQKSRNSQSLSRNSASHSSQTQHSIHSASTHSHHSNHSNNSHQMGSSEDNLQNTGLTSTNTSLEMVIPEENELIQMPNHNDVHNGRITSYVRNGQMNPIYLQHKQQQQHVFNNNNNHNNNKANIDDIEEEDSYEESHSNVVDDDIVVDDDQYIQQTQRHSNGHNKRIVTNSFLKSTTNDKKKVSFGGVQSTVTFDATQQHQNDNNNNNGDNTKCQSPISLSQTSESPSLTSHGSTSQAPHLLIQSQTGGTIGLQQSVMATLTPNGQKINQDGNYPYPSIHHNQNEPLVFGANVSKTAPSSPLQKKFKFSPQVSSIKNQRHSVVSIAMIEKIREKKALLDTHANGTATPSLSVGSLDEEYDNDDEHMNNINVSYYNNDTHHMMLNNSKPSHQVPFIQRSGTEDDILHQNREKNRNRNQYKHRSTNTNKYRNGVQSTTSSPKYGSTKSKSPKKFGWQKRAHSYRPQRERYVGSDGLYTNNNNNNNNSNNNNTNNNNNKTKRNSHLHSKTADINHINGLNPNNVNISPPLRRTKSDLSKNKNKKQQMLKESKLPPATEIISNTKHAEISSKKHNNNNNHEQKDNVIPSSLFTSMSKSIVKDRMNKIDIENLIPLTVSRYISYMAEKTGNPKLTPPQRWDFTTVAMFADVSGFTKLSEYLAKAGAGGAEKLAFYLNRYLEQLANKARKEGGDVFKFAGDAIIIVWPPDFDEESLLESEKKILREERIARAVQAARAIQNEFHNMEIIKGAITLSVKIGIGYGPSSLLFVGGQFGRIEYLMCGSALKQAFDCESYASPGDVIISKEAYQYVKEKYVYGRAVYDDVVNIISASSTINDINNDNHHVESPKKSHRGVLTRALSSNKHSNHSHHHQNHQSQDQNEILSIDNNDEKNGESPTSPSSTSRYTTTTPTTTSSNINNNNNEPIVYKVMLDRKKYKKVHSKALRSNDRYLISEHLQSFVPRAAWQRLLLRYKPWHGEQRAVTVLFINLDFNAYDESENNSATLYHAAKKKKRSNLENMPQDLLQKAVKTTQKCIYRYKGSLNKFLFDDKGSTVIAVFGLPPIANFDDCTRAVLAALLIEQKMKSLKIKARIGVTTGRVYIGVVGAAGSASEYGILGDQVNLAARLMQHAIKKIDKGGLGGEGVVVSDTTYAQAKECINIDWQRLQSTSVKGFTKEFIIWRPHWRKIKGDLSMKRNRFFIGWKETMDEIKSRLLKLTKSDQKERGYVVAIHADHWGGATQFARQLLHEIHEQIYVVGTTNLAFNDEKLFAWKALLSRIVRECRLLRGDTKEMDIKFRKSFKRFLTDTNGQHLIKYLPVLNELLNTKFISSDYSINSIVPDIDENNDYQDLGHQKLKSYTNVVVPNKSFIEEQDILTEEQKKDLLLKYRVEIIIHLLKQVSKYSTMVILISKLQYMDLDDWAITETIANKINNGELCDVSLVLAGWSMDTKSLTYLISPEEQQIQKNFTKIKKLCWLEFVLPKWTKQEVRDFLKYEFDIEKPSKNVLHFIVNKTDGIPGMVKCLVHDQNLLFLKHGGHLDCSQIERCRDIQSGSRYSDINLPIPYAIQSYYTKMLDSLDQFALLTIKCAAVISVGQEYLSVSFAYDMLYACHPLNNDVVSSNSDQYDQQQFDNELHSALSLLERDRFVYKFKQNKLTQEMIRLSDHQDQKYKHDNETFYVFASGFLRDVTYGNMLYKQRSAIHKRVKKMLDREPLKNDELVQNCIRRHHLLSLHDGFYSNRDEVERKREEILKEARNGKGKNKLYMDQHHSIWSFPECVLVLYIQDVNGLPDSLKSSSYVTIHVGDDKGKSLTQSISCHNQYMSVVLSQQILTQIEDEHVGPVLTMRLWYRQNYRVDKTIGKFTLRLRELYEKQLSEQMLWLQRKSELTLNNQHSHHSHSGRNSKRNSLNNNSSSFNNPNTNNIVYDHTDLFVGYKMTVHVKQKKINRFHLENNKIYIESFIRFCSVDDGSKMQHNLQTMLPFAQQQ